MSTLNKTNRRDFLKITSLTGGGLVLGFSWFGAEATPVVVSKATIAGDLSFNPITDTLINNKGEKVTPEDVNNTKIKYKGRVNTFTAGELR